LNQVGEYRHLIANDQLDDMILINFLRNWLVSHIMGVDMQYANKFNEDQAHILKNKHQFKIA
jgi:methyl-accepting chemotaxis protein/hemerythrin